MPFNAENMRQRITFSVATASCAYAPNRYVHVIHMSNSSNLYARTQKVYRKMEGLRGISPHAYDLFGRWLYHTVYVAMENS